MSTLLGIISDVHADTSALEEALRAMKRLRVDRVVCAGDIVDYGRDPEGTIRLLRESGVVCIRGNHDSWALKGIGDHAKRLSPGALAFLRTLPKRCDIVVEGLRIAIRHARPPEDDMLGIDPDVEQPEDLAAMLFEADRADVLIVGHTHRSFRLEAKGGGIVVNPGALLRDPERGVHVPTPGTFATLELPGCHFTVRYAFDGAPVGEHT